MFSSEKKIYALLPDGERRSESVDFDPENDHASAHIESTASLKALRQAIKRNI